MSITNDLDVNSGAPRLAVLAVLAGLCGVALYRPTLSADFIALDDPQYVLDNPYVLNPSGPNLAAFFSEVLQPTTVGGYYQPLTMASLMLDRVIDTALGGDPAQPPAPFVFHLHNILLHGVNAALVVLLVRHIVGLRWIALLAGVAFAVHPLNVEPVAWVCQRKAVLSMTFVLLTFLAYGRWVVGGRRGYYWAAVGCFLLSLLAKPTSLFLPIVLLLADVWPLERVRTSDAAPGAATNVSMQVAIRRASPLALLIEKWPFVLLAVVFGVIAYVSQLRSSGLAHMVAASDTGQTILVTCHNVVFYLVKCIVPMGLCPQYPLPPAEEISLSRPAFAVGLAVTVVIAVFIGIAWRRGWRPVWTMLLGFYLLLGPSLGPVRFMGAIAGDRFVYAPMLLLIILGAVGMRRARALVPAGEASGGGSPLVRLPVVILSIAVLGLFAWRALAQQAHWMDSRAYYAAVRDRFPNDPAGYFGLGMACLVEHDTWLADPAREASGRGEELLDEALGHFQKTISLRHTYSDAYFQIAEILRIRGRPAEALEWIDRAASFPEADRKSHFCRGLALGAMGRYAEAAEAYRAHLVYRPRQREAIRNLANALFNTGRFNEALEQYAALERLDPTDADNLSNYGKALAFLGRPAAALRPLAGAIRQFGDRYHALEAAQASAARLTEVLHKIADAQFAAAQADVALGRKEEALALLRQALENKPALLAEAEAAKVFAELRSTAEWAALRGLATGPPTSGPAATKHGSGP